MLQSMDKIGIIVSTKHFGTENTKNTAKRIISN